MLIEAGANPRPTTPALKDSLELELEASLKESV